MNRPYDVRVSARAARDLDRLPEKIAAACVEFLFGPLAEDPHRLGGALGGQFAGLRSARRGSYRIIYAVSDDAVTDDIDEAIGKQRNILEIVHIDHRRHVYR